MSAGSTSMRRSQCPCAPPAGLSADRLNMLFDVWASRDLYSRIAEILRSNPGGAAAVFFHLPSLQESKIEGVAHEEMSLDEMTELARSLLFGKRVPGFESKFAKNHSPLDVHAEVLFYQYQQGVCLDCPALIKNANGSGNETWPPQLRLRTLLGLFDQNGEPIPNELREWSTQSRLKAPLGKPGRPRKIGFATDASSTLLQFSLTSIPDNMAYAVWKRR